MDAKTVGNEFENKFTRILSDKGFFVYRVPNKERGQPFDIIATKNNIFYAFECKNCEKDIFQLSRVEDNQILSFKKLSTVDSTNYFFAFNFGGDIKLCKAMDIMQLLDLGIKQLKKNAEGLLYGLDSI